MPVHIEGLDGFRALVGQHIGYSDWLEITQDRIDTFADATNDHQWIHVDPDAAKAGPFGATIAHGYLTLSLGPAFAYDIFEVAGVSMALNYGLEKLRFPTPVVVGSKVRLGIEVKDVTDLGEGQIQTNFVYSFEVDGAEKPACVAEVLTRIYA